MNIKTRYVVDQHSVNGKWKVTDCEEDIILKLFDLVVEADRYALMMNRDYEATLSSDVRLCEGVVSW